MTNEEKRGWRFPAPGVRIGLYLLIIAALLLLRARRPNESELSGPPPTVDDFNSTAKTGADESSVLDQFYPDVTLYAWSNRKQENGAQRIEVLLKFARNVSELQWSELKLRGPGDNAKDLATALAPPDQPKPTPGMSIVRFDLPPDAAPFKEGQIWCWHRALRPLFQGQRLTHEILQKNYEEALKKEKGLKSEGPEAPPDEKGKPVSPTQDPKANPDRK